MLIFNFTGKTVIIRGMAEFEPIYEDTDYGKIITQIDGPFASQKVRMPMQSQTRTFLYIVNKEVFDHLDGKREDACTPLLEGAEITEDTIECDALLLANTVWKSGEFTKMIVDFDKRKAPLNPKNIIFRIHDSENKTVKIIPPDDYFEKNKKKK
jgi:hypothetical protein